MKDLLAFQGFGITDGKDQYATRLQIEKLYNLPRKTLADIIKALKEDGLISGAKIRHTAADGKQYLTEVYNLNEVIAIGFRSRSDTAIRLQRYAADFMSSRIRGLMEEKRMLELELSYAWNRSDNQDLYR